MGPAAGGATAAVLRVGIAVAYDGGLMAEIAGDAVFALDPTGELVRISLPDGAVTVAQTEVLHFDVSRDGRYLVWQSGDLRYYSSAPEGDILLRDREVGGEQVIGHGFLGHSPPAIREPFIDVPAARTGLAAAVASEPGTTGAAQVPA